MNYVLLIEVTDTKKTVDKKDFKPTQQIKTKDCHLLHAIAGRLLSASHSGSLSEYSH